MARQALFDLMKSQETYRAKYNKYTNQLAELLKLNLKYNNGRVYLEIHSAGKDDYRAISLPAESSTARVFVYDTSEGGFYEASEIEVSKYVLGALNFIRSEKKKQKTSILLAAILIGSLTFLGFRFVTRYKAKESNNALIAYFISLIPLGWAVSILNYMNSEIFFTLKILTFSLIAITISIVSIFITYLWMKNRNPLIVPAPVLGLAGCTLFIALSSAGTVMHSLLKYYPMSTIIN